MVNATKCSAVEHTCHPLATEAVWWAICRHLTIPEWARVAGTCKVSWRLQFHPKVVISPDLPSAGMLKKRLKYAYAWTYCQLGI